jgi:2-hydroxy-6-oxonona-2,4-dienedioate hydrolase
MTSALNLHPLTNRRGRSPWGWAGRLKFAVLGGGLVLALMYALAGSLAAAEVSPNGDIAGLKSKFVDVKGVRTRYYEYGSGEPLVLLAGGDANHWSKNIPGLAKQFHVFAVDRIRTGMTGNPLDDSDYNDAGDIKFLYNFLQAMKLDRIHLMGHSGGGALSFYFSMAHPEMVKTLILVADGPEDPHVGFRLDDPKQQEEARYDILAPKDPNLNLKAMVDVMVEKCAGQPNCRTLNSAYAPEVAFDEEFLAAETFFANLPVRKEGQAKIRAGAGEPMRTKDHAAWLKAQWDRAENEGPLQMPILLYRGKQDSLDWPANDPAPTVRQGLATYDILGAKNPNVKMIVMNHAGHYMMREFPDVFNQDIINFIEYWDHHPAAPRKLSSRASH